MIAKDAESIRKLALTLKMKLTDEEFLALYEISGDYAEAAVFYRELGALVALSLPP